MTLKEPLVTVTFPAAPVDLSGIATNSNVPAAPAPDSSVIVMVPLPPGRSLFQVFEPPVSVTLNEPSMDTLPRRLFFNDPATTES